LLFDFNFDLDLRWVFDLFLAATLTFCLESAFYSLLAFVDSATLALTFCSTLVSALTFYFVSVLASDLVSILTFVSTLAYCYVVVLVFV